MLSSIKNKLDNLDSYSRNSLFFVFEGTAAAAIFNLTNPFLSMFAKRMGAGDFEIGMVNSLPALIAILALIPGSLLVDAQYDKKRIVCVFILITGILYPLAALTPFMGSRRVYLYAIIIALANWPFSVFNISWQSFFSDVFPCGRRNFAYASRTRAYTFIGITVQFAAGLILAYIPHSNRQRIAVYQVFFASVFILALLQIWFLSRVKEYEPPERKPLIHPFPALKQSLKSLISNMPFLKFTSNAFVFHISWQMAWPLFFLYQVDYLHMNEAWLSYINVAVGIAGIITYPFWSRMIERKGANWTLIAGAIGLSMNPLLIITTKSLYVAFLYNVLLGLTFSAFQLALFENLMDTVPQENKTLNIAIYTTLINVSGFISPMIGVWLYRLTSIYISMSISGALRFCATGLFVLSYIKSIKALRKNKSLDL